MPRRRTILALSKGLGSRLRRKSSHRVSEGRESSVEACVQVEPRPEAMPSTRLYRHAHKPVFVLLSEAYSPNCGRIAVGKLRQLPEVEMQNDCLNIVLSDLAGFATRDAHMGSEIDATSPTSVKSRRLLSSCWLVLITQVKNNELELSPMLDLGNGRGIGNTEGLIKFRLPNGNGRFFTALTKAFDSCYVTTGV